MRTLAIGVFVLVVVGAADVMDVDDIRIEEYNDYVVLVSDVQEHYKASSVFLIHAGDDESIRTTTLMLHLTREFSGKFVLSLTLNYTDLTHHYDYYRGRILRPLFVVLLSSPREVDVFQNVTREFEMSYPIWLIIFTEPMPSLCSPPRRGNLFNVNFDTEMMIKCHGDPNLREWYSIVEDSTESYELASWDPVERFRLRTSKSLYGRRHTLAMRQLRLGTVRKQDSQARPAIKFRILKGDFTCSLCQREFGTPFNVKTLLCMDNFNGGVICTTDPAPTNLANPPRKRRYELMSQDSAAVTLSKCSQYTFDVSLTFTNHLHDVSQDYGYEVEFDVHVKSGGLCQKICLFSQQQMRRSQKITFEKQEFYNTYVVMNMPHLYCSIRRFSVKDNGRSSNPGDNYRALLKCGSYSDVVLVVGDKSFPAHKLVLTSKSDIFKAMFSHAEMAENVNGIVTIVDIDAKIVEEMLYYLYTGRVLNLATCARQLFSAADKYQLHELRAQCEEQLLFDLNCENLTETLELTLLYEVPRLKSGALSFLYRHASEVVQQENLQRYLCRTLDNTTLVNALKICANHELASLKAVAFEFIKNHGTTIAEDPKFMDLFDLHPYLMKEIFTYVIKPAVVQQS